MTPYKNLGGDSNVVAYANWADFIIVQFKPNKSHSCTTYTYTYQSAGAQAIEDMKKLADAGRWLNAYINKHKPGFSSKK